MNEARYAGRVRQALNHGLQDISPAAARRLEAARHLALARQKHTAPQLAIAGHAASLLQGLARNHRARQILAMLALLLGMWISFYMDSVSYVTALEELDSALLSDELPPAAFLDNDFFAWLSDNSSEE